MFRCVLALAVSLSASSLVGYAQPLPDRVPLKGVVVDEAGVPVASAVLTVRRQNDTVAAAFWGAEARADSKGQFVFPEAEEGSYFLSVDAPGFASLANFAFDWSSKSSPARLQLLRLGQLRLRVLSPDGTPLSQAQVWVRLRDQNGQTPIRTVTNAQGEITIPDVAPTSYSLVVLAQNGIATESSIGFKSSQTAPIEARLREGATLRISAKDADGKALGGASLILFAQSPEETARLAGENADPGENWAQVGAANSPPALVSRDGSGMVELKHLPVGQFSARFYLPGYGTQSRELKLEDGKVVEWKADFPARREATLSVLVRNKAGQLVTNAPVALRLLPLAQNGTFDAGNALPEDGAPDMPFASSGAGSRVVMTDENGQASLFPVRPGSYRIFAARISENGYLRAPVEPEGAPADLMVSLNGPNTGEVQVP